MNPLPLPVSVVKRTATRVQAAPRPAPAAMDRRAMLLAGMSGATLLLAPFNDEAKAIQGLTAGRIPGK